MNDALFSLPTACQLCSFLHLFAQLVSLAAFIALLVDRMTTPHARIVFSNVAILGSFNGQPSINFRLAHERPGALVDASIRVFIYVRRV